MKKFNQETMDADTYNDFKNDEIELMKEREKQEELVSCDDCVYLDCPISGFICTHCRIRVGRLIDYTKKPKGFTTFENYMKDINA